MEILHGPAADSIAEFARPSNAFRGKPFWSWNGELDREELLRQVRVFQEMGMGGFFMHSRTGLKTEYLGDEWFELINACADEAEKLGLEAWLYDEDRWPSGSAGGLATANPAYRLKSLRLTILPVADFAWPDNLEVAAAFQASVEKLDVTDSKRIEPGQILSKDGGDQVLLFTIETTKPHTFYNGHTYLDTLKREATEHFIKITHERYREKCGDRLGRSIRGVFTDEPHHGMVMCHKTETRQEEQPEWTTPFTDSLFAEFERRFGYDLRARLPELFLFPGGRRISQVKWHYMELIQQLFLENWAKPLHDWCRAHGMLLTGHVLHEDSLAAQAVPCGSLMRYYEFLDYPGVDVLGSENRNFCIVKQLASAARQLGKPWMLSELYGCTGWQLDFAGHKEIGTWQALFGINVRCHHLAWFTMGGEAKRDYPASIGFQSAWYRQYAAVEDYFSRLHVVLQRGEAVCDVLVISPIESLWAQIHAGWATWLCAQDPIIELIEERYRQIFAWLTRAHIDFDYGDEDHVARLARVVADSGGAPLLRLGHGKYRVAVVAGLETIRASTLEMLRKFAGAGGTVIFAGAAPDYVDALPSSAARDLAADAESIPFLKETLVARIRAASSVPLRIAEGQPDAAADLLYQLRREGDLWFVVVLNSSKTAAHLDVEIRLCSGAPSPVEEWECATGARFSQPAEQSDRGLHWRTDFAPLTERVFVIGPQSTEKLPARPPTAKADGIKLSGPFPYELDEPNICVLDFAEHRLGDGEWQPAMEILQIDCSVRDCLGIARRSGAMIQPWARNHSQLPGASTDEGEVKSATPLTMRFKFDITSLPAYPVELMIEAPALFGICCNGVEIEPPTEPEWFIDPCFKRVPLPDGVLRLGENVIELAVPFSAEIDLEAIYLLGNFGVQLDGSRARLTVLPALLAPTDAALQGLPFYTGCISYRVPFDSANHRRDSQISLETGTFGGATVAMRTSSIADQQTIAWPPYIVDVTALLRGRAEFICDVWLTRRNTFGPLHLVPKEQPHIGPNSFRSDGAAFSDSYQLYPSGLLRPPILHISAGLTSG